MAAIRLTPESLAPLLQSNDAPEPIQKVLVKEILRSKEAELAALETEISALQSKLQTLQRSHAELASEMQLYSSILSPIRHLPPEIIGEIFLYFAPSLGSHFHGRHPSMQPPWKLGQICRLWRTIALSLGRLWSVLDISFEDHKIPECRRPRLVVNDVYDEYDKEEEQLTKLPRSFVDFRSIRYYEEAFEIETSLDLIRACVQRAGQQPLSIHFLSRLNHHFFAVSPLFDALLKHSARWGELVLPNPLPSVLNCLSDFQGNLQQLHTIAITNGNVFPFQHQRVPNLTNLSLKDFDMRSTSFPWSQLTRYSESNCTWDSSNRLASYRQLTNLVVLRLDFQDYSYQQPLANANTFSGTSPFPNLRAASFRFSYHSSTSMSAIHFFDMPVLEAFSLHDPNQNISPLAIPRSSPHLKIFRAHTDFLPISEVGTERLLETCPDLTDITLDTPGLITNQSISRLIPYHDRPPLGQKLKMIRVSNQAFLNNDCKWTTLLEMLRSRFEPTVAGIPPLHAFEYHSDKSWWDDKNVPTSLRALRDQTGWDIKVGDECRMPDWDDLYLPTT